MDGMWGFTFDDYEVYYGVQNWAGRYALGEGTSRDEWKLRDRREYVGYKVKLLH